MNRTMAVLSPCNDQRYRAVASQRAMNRRPVWAVLAFVVIAGTLVSLGLPDPGRGITRRGCPRRTTAAPHRRCAEASKTRTVGNTALRLYDDAIGDVLAAPDVAGESAVTNDNVSLTFGIRTQDRVAFEPFDSYSVLIDADSNHATGSPRGAEFLIDVSGRRSALTAWNGSDFEIVVPNPALPTAWVPGYGPVIRVGRDAIGDPPRFNVMLETRNGSDADLAPDEGSWPYEVKDFALTADAIRVGRAQAGKRLIASMRVIRSDFAVPLTEGHVQCNATFARKRVPGRRLATEHLITCAWPVPDNGRAKRIRGRVAVTFQGAIAAKSFNVPVVAG